MPWNSKNTNRLRRKFSPKTSTMREEFEKASLHELVLILGRGFVKGLLVLKEVLECIAMLMVDVVVLAEIRPAGEFGVMMVEPNNIDRGTITYELSEMHSLSSERRPMLAKDLF